MRKEKILKLPSMPAAGPSYPAGPLPLRQPGIHCHHLETEVIPCRFESEEVNFAAQMYLDDDPDRRRA